MITNKSEKKCSINLRRFGEQQRGDRKIVIFSFQGTFWWRKLKKKILLYPRKKNMIKKLRLVIHFISFGFLFFSAPAASKPWNIFIHIHRKKVCKYHKMIMCIASSMNEIHKGNWSFWLLRWNFYQFLTYTLILFVFNLPFNKINCLFFFQWINIFSFEISMIFLISYETVFNCGCAIDLTDRVYTRNWACGECEASLSVSIFSFHSSTLFTTV